LRKTTSVDLDSIDFGNVIANTDEIRKYNPQRFEMEQLTAIVYEDPVKVVCVGYKDVSENEFWVRGHMPGMPLMPGVVMLEAVAQVCCYCSHKYKLLGESMVGFGGLEDVRFRDPVLPGSRLVVMCELLKVRKPRLIVCRFQGVVGKNIVVEGVLKGIPIPNRLSQEPSSGDAKLIFSLRCGSGDSAKGTQPSKFKVGWDHCPGRQ
jgi:3-hydroxyacyl-[acyl-carrier-protein] dehydratase